MLKSTLCCRFGLTWSVPAGSAVSSLTDYYLDTIDALYAVSSFLPATQQFRLHAMLTELCRMRQLEFQPSCLAVMCSMHQANECIKLQQLIMMAV